MSKKLKESEFDFDKFFDSIHEYKELIHRRYLESLSAKSE
jgi:hypothetical protein